MLQGEMLAVSPWESHFDERLFGTGAAEFNPHREGLQGAPLGAVPGVAGLSGFTFGGGWFRCLSADRLWQQHCAGDPFTLARREAQFTCHNSSACSDYSAVLPCCKGCFVPGSHSVVCKAFMALLFLLSCPAAKG